MSVCFTWGFFHVFGLVLFLGFFLLFLDFSRKALISSSFTLKLNLFQCIYISKISDVPSGVKLMCSWASQKLILRKQGEPCNLFNTFIPGKCEKNSLAEMYFTCRPLGLYSVLCCVSLGVITSIQNVKFSLLQSLHRSPGKH